MWSQIVVYLALMIPLKILNFKNICHLTSSIACDFNFLSVCLYLLPFLTKLKMYITKIGFLAIGQTIGCQATGFGHITDRIDNNIRSPHDHFWKVLSINKVCMLFQLISGQSFYNYLKNVSFSGEYL